MGDVAEMTGEPDGDVRAGGSTPAGPRGLVSRERLLTRLDSTLAARVTLVTAPGGFGKSWLAADWLARSPSLGRSWVAVDQFDADVVRLWLKIARALDPSLVAPTSAGNDAGRGEVRVRDLIDLVVAELDAAARDVVMVLDDTHRLSGDSVRTSLEYFFEVLPASTHVVLLGRAAPDLRLSRLRLAGDLLEITADELLCTRQETEQVVAALGARLAPDQIDSLHNQTSGWMAGLRLSIASTEDHASGHEMTPTGTGRQLAPDALATYVAEEFLAPLDAADRSLLIATSVVDRVCGPLADAITGSADGTRRLHLLQATGVLVRVAVEESDGSVWYEVHQLVRDVLLTIAMAGPGGAADLHRRAGMWLHEHSDPVVAIWQMVAAGDGEMAGEWLLAASRDLMQAQQTETVLGLLRAVDELVDDVPIALLTTWSTAVLVGRDGEREIDSVLQRLRDKLTVALSDEAASGTDSATRDELEDVPYRFHHDLNELMRTVTVVLARRAGELPDEGALQTASESESGVVGAAWADMLTDAGRFAEAGRLLSRYIEFTMSDDNVISTLRTRSLGMSSKVSAASGELAEAERQASVALSFMPADGIDDRPQSLSASLALAWVQWQRGNLSEARGFVERLQPLIDHVAEVPSYVNAHVLRARCLGSQGDAHGARTELARAAMTPAGRLVRGFYRDWVTTEQVRLELIAGSVAAASALMPHWQDRLTSGDCTSREYLVLLRLAVLAGTVEPGWLDNIASASDVTVAHQIELDVLRSLHATARHNHPAALTSLTRAMAVAVTTGHRQVLLDGTDRLTSLMGRAGARAGLDLSSHLTSSPADEAAPGVVDFTDRELEILALLASELSYAEIGERLFISTNTVKSHIRGVYRKLGASRRSQAVIIARARNLLTGQ